jgi:hypothetical protein
MEELFRETGGDSSKKLSPQSGKSLSSETRLVEVLYGVDCPPLTAIFCDNEAR